ncbi:hypothetical protein [Alienimonas chondri]|uniref:TIGR03790 family protein n=1 Tax=Alienimonas chondri TaxID=2681879 RepID=A0ABX1VH67_9PLAN|nr:hypothetical protein [Alienimonas chondri]NNJ26116.1 hypothetical protein [Alienimonas chondri]
MSQHVSRSPRLRFLLAAALWSCVAVARADLGPENLILVVNGDSVASRTVANHYIAARGVADVAVVTLHDLPDWETLTVEQFRELILKPALTVANERGLAPQLEAVVYSTAIPTKIDLRGDLAGLDPKPNKVFTPYGSLTGLTMLYESVLQKRPAEYLAPNANAAFAGGGGGKIGPPPSLGFRRAIGFGENREPTTGPGRRYLLSTVLGVTTGRGESVEEVADRIEATAAADGMHPAGTILFCDTSDVRSTTRKPLFEPAVAAIKDEAAARELEVRAEVVTTALPQRSRDLIGLTAGVAGVKPTAWADSGSGFVPGGFADNLTSFGGVLSERPHGQVTAVDWLRFGAAASGGTVHEPYALAFKFPTPFVHLHRLRGLTLAEAIARSVAGPYQYLTVGDPLSNPYARRPVVALGLPQNDEDGSPLSGVVPLTLGVADGAGNPVTLERWELFADGKRFAVVPPGPSFNWKTADLPDGTHTLSAVAVAANEVRGRGQGMRAATVRNAGRRFVVRAAAIENGPERTVTWGEPLRLEAVANRFGPKEMRFSVLLGREEIGTGRLTVVHGTDSPSRGEAIADTRSLGLGPVTLRAEITPVDEDGQPGDPVRSAPIQITVVPTSNRAASVAGDVSLRDGPTLRWEGGETVPLPDGLPAGWLAKLSGENGTAFTLSAIVTATEPGLHRLALRSNCGMTVSVDGEPAPMMTGATLHSEAGEAWRSVPVWLAPGRHEITLSGRTPEGKPVLDLKWGRRGLLTPTGTLWQRLAEKQAP